MITRSDYKWFLARAIRRVAYNCVPIPVHLSIAELRGHCSLAFKGVPEHVHRNLDDVFSEDRTSVEIRQIARRCVKFKSKLYLGYVLPYMVGFNRTSRIRYEGIGHLDGALSEGRGAVLMTGHFGYAKILGSALRSRGYDVLSVVSSAGGNLEREDRIRSWLQQAGPMTRKLWSGILGDTAYERRIPAKLDIRPILSALKENSVVVVAGDGLKAAEYVHLPLLGREHPFAKGLMKIAKMSDTPVLPAFATEQGDGGICIRVFPRLHLGSDIAEALRGFVDVLDRQIRLNPHMWYRWSTPAFFEKARQWSAGAVENRWDSGFGAWASSNRESLEEGLG